MYVSTYRTVATRRYSATVQCYSILYSLCYPTFVKRCPWLKKSRSLDNETKRLPICLRSTWSGNDTSLVHKRNFIYLVLIGNVVRWCQILRYCARNYGSIRDKGLNTYLQLTYKQMLHCDSIVSHGIWTNLQYLYSMYCNRFLLYSNLSFDHNSSGKYQTQTTLTTHGYAQMTSIALESNLLPFPCFRNTRL